MSIEKMPDEQEDDDYEVTDRVDDLRHKGYADDEIFDSMSVDEGIEKERIEKAMKKLDEEKEKKETEGGEITNADHIDGWDREEQ